jgi:DNA-directed RNA polymerase subunit RPC12/RpoP
MAYVSINMERKKEIIRDYWSGERITNIEKKYGVSRFSVRTWSSMADEAITNILGERNHTDKIEELEDEIKKLKDKLEELSIKYKKLSQFSQNVEGLDEYEPVICEDCGCTILWKNGKITRKEDKRPKEGLVQRYTCSNCKANIYVVKKNSG